MRKKQFNSDEDLWNGLRLEDPEALRQIVLKYSDKLLDYGFRFIPDEELVKDCVQDVFHLLWSKRTSLKEVSFPKAYLMKSLRNKMMREKDKWNIGNEIEELDSQNLPPEFIIQLDETNLLSDDLNAKLQEYIAKLSTRQKEVLYLRFYEGIKPKDIAVLMNINTQSVYNLMQSSLLSLRKMIDYQSIKAILSLGLFVVFKK